MANVKRTSTDNIFGNKGTVIPKKKVGDVPVEFMSISDKFDEKPQEDVTEEQAEATVSENKIEEAKPARKTEPEKKPEKSLPSKSSLDKLFKGKRGNGVQRTLYFKKDVFDYCLSISKQYGINLSEVVNKLIEPYMEEEDEF